jgi:hypothetical protein
MGSDNRLVRGVGHDDREPLHARVREETTEVSAVQIIVVSRHGNFVRHEWCQLCRLGTRNNWASENDEVNQVYEARRFHFFLYGLTA